MPIAAPADRRFRRASVSYVRRSPWRRRLRTVAIAIVIALAALYAGGRLLAIVLRSPALAIGRVSVAGHARLSEGEVRALLAGLEGSNLISLDLDAWKRKLLSSPWIADADIRRVFPDGVSVTVTEREPAAVARVEGVPYLIDHAGTLIEEFGPGHADLDLPIVDGLATARTGMLLVDEPRARLAGRLLSALRASPELAGAISQIDVTDVRDAVVVFKDDTTLVHVGTDRFAERLQTYLDLAAYLRARVPEIDYVDLRYGDRVYVGPRRSAQRRGRRG